MVTHENSNYGDFRQACTIELQTGHRKAGTLVNSRIKKSNERKGFLLRIRNQGARLIFKIVNPNIVWKPGELQSVYVSILTMHKSFEILEVLDDSLPVSSNDTRINCTEERAYL